MKFLAEFTNKRRERAGTRLQLRNANNSKDKFYAQPSLPLAYGPQSTSASLARSQRRQRTTNRSGLPVNCSQISFQHFSTALFLKRARVPLFTSTQPATHTLIRSVCVCVRITVFRSLLSS